MLSNPSSGSLSPISRAADACEQLVTRRREQAALREELGVDEE